MQSKATTVQQYLDGLPEERRAIVAKVRSLIRKHLPKGMTEQMNYGMIGYVVPHRHYPPGYHCDPKQPLPFAGLASQKNYFALYLMSVYMKPELEAALRAGYQAAGKKLDMGKSCIRFKKWEDLAADAIAQAVGGLSMPDYIMVYEDSLKASKTRRKG